MSRLFWKKLELLGAIMLMTRSKCKHGECKNNNLNSTYNRRTANWGGGNQPQSGEVVSHTYPHCYKLKYLFNQTENLPSARDHCNEFLILIININSSGELKRDLKMSFIWQHILLQVEKLLLLMTFQYTSCTHTVYIYHIYGRSLG